MITITINPITLNPNANHEADVGGGGPNVQSCLGICC